VFSRSKNDFKKRCGKEKRLQMRMQLTPQATAELVEKRLVKAKRLFDARTPLDEKTVSDLRTAVERLHTISNSDLFLNAVSGLKRPRNQRGARVPQSPSLLFIQARFSIGELREMLAVQKNPSVTGVLLGATINERINDARQLKLIFARVNAAARKGKLNL
jgi:hypothetical protein